MIFHGFFLRPIFTLYPFAEQGKITLAIERIPPYKEKPLKKGTAFFGLLFQGSLKTQNR